VKSDFIRLTTFGILGVGFFTIMAIMALSDRKELEVYHPREEIQNFNLRFAYGFNLDSFVVHEGTFKRNQFLADVLLKHNVNYKDIDELVKKSKPVFDVRRIAAGRKYTVLCNKTEKQEADFLIYEKNPVEYIVFDLTNEVGAYTGMKEVQLEEQTASGTISTSLYNALVGSDLSPLLAFELAEIFAWTIDFYRLQKDDRFKIIYKERFVDGQSTGIEKIDAALFTHRGDDNFAFYFEQGKDDGAYFDEKGDSQQREFMKAPIKFSRISSRFSYKRFHPVQKRYKAHLGTDYAAPHGTPIIAVGDGTVIEARRKSANGNYVKIRHNGTYSTMYLHMSKFAKGVHAGVRVKQGQVIGYVGSTGLATGPHVCYRFWKNGNQVNHLREKFPPSRPVSKEYRSEYEKYMIELKERLSSIAYQEDLITHN